MFGILSLKRSCLDRTTQDSPNYFILMRDTLVQRRDACIVKLQHNNTFHVQRGAGNSNMKRSETSTYVLRKQK